MFRCFGRWTEHYILEIAFPMSPLLSAMRAWYCLVFCLPVVAQCLYSLSPDGHTPIPTQAVALHIGDYIQHRHTDAPSNGEESSVCCACVCVCAQKAHLKHAHTHPLLGHLGGVLGIVYFFLRLCMCSFVRVEDFFTLLSFNDLSWVKFTPPAVRERNWDLGVLNV